MGLPFVGMYVMKQFFRPRLYGLFIAGMFFLAYCVSEPLDSTWVISLVFGASLLGWFYLRNRRAVDQMVDEMDSVSDDELENFDYVAPESFEEPPAADASAEDGDPASGPSDPADGSDASDDDGMIEIETKIPAPKAKTVEFDFEPKEGKKK